MDDDYSLSDAYVKVGSEGLVPNSVDRFAQSIIVQHYMLTFAIVIVLVVVVLWFLYAKYYETFNPTQSTRDQDGDQWGLGKRSSTPPFTSATTWQVLNSSEFDCANRKDIGDDAWGWMSNVSKESLQGSNKPKTDNDFSKVLAGH
jgi:hypothetical protein